MRRFEQTLLATSLLLALASNGAVSLLLTTSASTHAQELTQQDPADRLRREQQERERLERLQQQSPEVAVPETDAVDLSAAPEMIADPEPTFLIERIVLIGNTVLTQDQAGQITKPFSGIRLGVNRINLLLRRLTQAFIDRGYITTRAYIGNQNLASGTLEITIVPGTIEKLQYNGNDLGIGERLAFPTQAGNPLKLADLEQGIDQLQRLRRNQVELQILPGDTPGGSIVSVKNTPGDRFYYNVGVDNYGDEHTGNTRYRAGFEANNIIGLQESLGLNYVGSLDTNALLLSSSLPVGYNTFSYAYSYSEFQSLIADAALMYGRSRGHTLAWNHLLGRSRLTKSGVDVSLSVREAEREINNIELTPQKLSVVRVAYNKLRRFQWDAVPGFWTIDVGYARGLNGFGATDDPTDLPREGAHAQFDKFDLSASVGAQPSTAFAYRGMLAAQWSKDALFSSEQIFSGGATTVRGFAENALAGDRGMYTRQELSYAKVPRLWQDRIHVEPYLFIDGGRLQLIAERTWRTIAGTGIGLRVSSKHVSTDLIFAKPVVVPETITDDKFRIHATLNVAF